MEINRDAIGENAAAIEWYIHKLAHFTVCTIGPDQILAGEGVLATALDIFGEYGDAVVVLIDVDDLKSIRDLGAGLLGAPP